MWLLFLLFRNFGIMVLLKRGNIMSQNIAIILIILNIAVYLKVPEFLQTLITKRLDKRIAEIQIENEKRLNQIQLDFQREYQKIEQDFTTNLEIYKKRYSVLPELYKVIAEFEAAVNQKGNPVFPSSDKSIMNHFGIAKNFRALNQFYISEELLKLSNKCITVIFDLHTEKMKLEKCHPNLIDISMKKVTELEELKNGYIKELEKKIHETIPK